MAKTKAKRKPKSKSAPKATTESVDWTVAESADEDAIGEMSQKTRSSRVSAKKPHASNKTPVKKDTKKNEGRISKRKVSSEHFEESSDASKPPSLLVPTSTISPWVPGHSLVMFTPQEAVAFLERTARGETAMAPVSYDLPTGKYLKYPVVRSYHLGAMGRYGPPSSPTETDASMDTTVTTDTEMPDRSLPLRIAQPNRRWPDDGGSASRTRY